MRQLVALLGLMPVSTASPRSQQRSALALPEPGRSPIVTLISSGTTPREWLRFSIPAGAKGRIALELSGKAQMLVGDLAGPVQTIGTLVGTFGVGAIWEVRAMTIGISHAARQIATVEIRGRNGRALHMQMKSTFVLAEEAAAV